MPTFHRHILLLICIIASAAAPCGAAAGKRCADFRNISQAGPLLDMTVSSVVRDSTGYVWLGTGLGVDRFDGVRVKHYPIAGADAKYRRVATLAAHPSGDIYAGNGDGLWVLKPDADEFVRAVTDSVRASVVGAVNALHITREGHVLAGTGNGLYDFDPATGRPERVPLVDSRLAAPSNRVTDMAVGGDTLFLATDAGLVVLAYNAAVLYSHPYPFNSIAMSGNRIFLGTDSHGVVAFDRKSGRMERYGDTADAVVTDLAVDSRGRLYVATDGAGVTVIDTHTDAVADRYVHRAGHDGGLSSNAVYAVYADADDLLWVGYYQLGASYTLYSAGLFSVYAEDGYSTAGRAVRVVKRHGRYTLVGTRDGVEIIDRSGDGSVRLSHYEAPRLRSNTVISAALYRNRFVVGLYGGGMQIIDPATGAVEDFAVPGMDNPFRRGHVFCLTPHPDGSLWAGTSAGLFRFEPGKEIRRWTSDNSQLPPGNIYAIFFDSKGNGWVCTENGLAVFDPERGNITGSVFPKGFFNSLKFKEVYEDSRGRLYFLPEHGDIYVSNTAMTEFGVLDTPPVSNLEPRAIIEDGDGCMWLATSCGIFSRPAEGSEWIEYGSTDGVVSPLFINCTPALDSEGRLWFGNSRGLLTVYPHEVERRAGDGGFSLTLNEVLVNGTPLKGSVEQLPEGGYSIDFPRHAGSIMLRLSPLNFSDPQNMHYQYKLDGGDGEEWRDLDHTFDLSFYDMAGGTHRLLLRQAGRPDTQICIELEVPYPMWLWICVFAALVALCSVAAYIYHIRRLRAAQAANMPLPAAEAAAGAPSQGGEQTQRKYKTYSMREDEGRAIARRLDEIMSESKPYTNPDLRLADLAEMADVSAHRLSFYFSQYLHQSFYDYVNARRIDEFKRLAGEPDADRYTLSALSAKAGFSSRTSFFRYFKKAEGLTPAEYVEKLKK